MKLITKTLPLIALAAFTIVTPANAVVNLLVNGSFETGDFTGWTIGGSNNYGGPATIFTADLSAEPVGGRSPDPVGTHEVYYHDDLSTESLSQLVHLTPGSYQIGFSADLQSYQNSGAETYTATVGGRVGAQISTATSVAGWHLAAGSVIIATEGDYTVAFTYNTNQIPSKDMMADRLYLLGSGVPEPATWALMLSGFGLVGLATRRRRSGALAA